MSAVLDDEVAADPVAVIVRLVAEVERGLTAGQIAGVVIAVAWCGRSLTVTSTGYPRGVAGSLLMNEGGRVWHLMRDGELRAELEVTGDDFPWLNAQVRPMAGFAEVRPLFQEELRRLDRLGSHPGA